MSAATAAAIAASYGLGVVVGDPVYAARGEQGRIWRLDTASGSWAVKEMLLPVAAAGAARDVDFQLAARAAGIPLPLPCRTRDGRVVLPAGEAAPPWSVRVYRWADLAGGQAVTGGVIVLDWENSGPAQPERELAAIMSDLAADVSPQAAQAAYAAYQAAGGPATLSRTAHFATAAAVQGHLLQFYSRRALDPNESGENRARSSNRLDHMLRQPLTMSRIDRLLELLAQ